MPPLFDTHAHLQEPEFAGDIDAVLERARAAGVDSILLPGVDLGSSLAAARLAEAHDAVYAAAGYHPHEAEHLDEAGLAAIEALLEHPRVVATGEIGLDYYRMHSPRDAQVRVLESMLELAAARGLPVVIHCRDAWDDMAAILEPWAERTRAAYEGPLGVMHYFTGSVEQALRYVDLGFSISVHTSVTHPKATGLREVVAALPLEALVIETDSPYGAPQSQRGRRNEPAYVLEAARQIAEIRGLTVEAVSESTSAAARRLFRLPVPAASKGGA